MSQFVQEHRDEEKDSSNQTDYPIGAYRPTRVNRRKPVDGQRPGKEYKDDNPANINIDVNTGKLADTLLVEKELSRVRLEIERLEGRLRFLSHRISYSTITVTLKEAARLRGVKTGAFAAPPGEEGERKLAEFADWFGNWWPGVLRECAK